MQLTKYKLGDLIVQRREKNNNYDVPIRGVSKDGFIRAKQQEADTSIYNVFYKYDFVFNPARMELNSIALNLEYEKALCSSLYEVFYVKDENIVLPEFLNLHIKRDEFARHCDYIGLGSAREYCRFANISEFDIELPPIEVQQEIVEADRQIKRRIHLNNQVIQHLEATAQALYRKTFVDNIDKENLPEGWRMGTLGEIADIKNGKAIVPVEGDIPIYGGNGIVGYTNSSNAENVVVIGRVGINCGSLYLHQSKCYVNDNAMIAIPKNGNTIFLYRTMKEMDLNSQSEGSGQPLLTQSIIYKQECLIPKLEQRIKFEEQMRIVYKLKSLKEADNANLTELQSLLLAKMGQ